MEITITQYLRWNRRKKTLVLEIPDSCKDKYQLIVDKGCSITCEQLGTGYTAQYISHSLGDFDCEITSPGNKDDVYRALLKLIDSFDEKAFDDWLIEQQLQTDGPSQQPSEAIRLAEQARGLVRRIWIDLNPDKRKAILLRLTKVKELLDELVSALRQPEHKVCLCGGSGHQYCPVHGTNSCPPSGVGCKGDIIPCPICQRSDSKEEREFIKEMQGWLTYFSQHTNAKTAAEACCHLERMDAKALVRLITHYYRQAGELENLRHLKPCPYNSKVQCVQYPSSCGCDPCESCPIRLEAQLVPTEAYEGLMSTPNALVGGEEEIIIGRLTAKIKKLETINKRGQ